jgi:hypothetical protein
MELSTTKTTRRTVLQRGSQIISYAWGLRMLRSSLFMTSVMATSKGTAGGVSLCPVDTVPIQITNEIRSGPESTLSAAQISNSDPHFRAFVMAVTAHVAARLAKDKLCIDSTSSKKRSLLQFVKWPIVISDTEPLAPVPSLDAQPSGGCRISSPWIDISFERRPVPQIRAVIRWNERQFLADQAVLAGARNVPPGVAMPLKQREIIHFAEGEYADSEILREPALRPIEERVPPDLLWLFRRSTQSTRGPFIGMASSSMRKAIEKSAERYTQLVIALIDRCFASDGVAIHYNNIFDVADLISLEQYKITTPIR